MAPWKFTKYLHEIKDFENLEYRSEINVWNNTNNVFENDLMKVQFVEFDLPRGSIVHIPNYWWYSIKYKDRINILFECNIVPLLIMVPTYGIIVDFFYKNKILLKILQNESQENTRKKNSNHEKRKMKGRKKVGKKRKKKRKIL